MTFNTYIFYTINKYQGGTYEKLFINDYDAVGVNAISNSPGGHVVT